MTWDGVERRSGDERRELQRREEDRRAASAEVIAARLEEVREEARQKHEAFLRRARSAATLEAAARAQGIGGTTRGFPVIARHPLDAWGDAR